MAVYVVVGGVGFGGVGFGGVEGKNEDGGVGIDDDVDFGGDPLVILGNPWNTELFW